VKKKPASHAAKASAKDPSRYPKGWDRKKVRAALRHYENHSDADAIAEAGAACESNCVTMMAVPVELFPKVQKLIARRAG
jgi:hypothetical protein